MSSVKFARRFGREILATIGGFHSESYRKIRTAIVLKLPSRSANILAKYRLDILRRQSISSDISAPSHITLKLGFLCSDVESLAGFIQEFATRKREVQVRVKNFASFDDSVLYADVLPNPQLDQLRMDLLSNLCEKFDIIPYEIEGDSFHFHVTLASNMKPKACIQELMLLKERSLDIEFTASDIALMCLVGEQWFIFHESKLLVTSSDS